MSQDCDSFPQTGQRRGTRLTPDDVWRVLWHRLCTGLGGLPGLVGTGDLCWPGSRVPRSRSGGWLRVPWLAQSELDNWQPGCGSFPAPSWTTS